MAVRLADGIPLKGATVRLENGEDHQHTIATKTDAALVDTAAPGGSAAVEANQQFTLKDLIDGGARVQVLGAAEDCYVKQIRFGQIFVKDDVISVSKGTNPALEITG
jgi:hypothetical protein